MTKDTSATWEAQFEGYVQWVRRLPFLFRLTRIPLVGRLIFRDSFVGDPTTKAWMVPVHEPIALPDSVHLPLDLLRPMIEKAAAIARVKECMCRRAFHCKYHPHDIACLALGSPFQDAEKHGLERLTQAEAIKHVEAAVTSGLVPTVIWEKEMETIFDAPRHRGLAVCFCCDCCCDYRLGLRRGGPRFRQKVFRPEGVSVIVDDSCNLCGICAEPDVCSVNAIRLGEDQAMIDLSRCVGCGHCVQVCPSEAISFVVDPNVDVIGKLLAHVEAYTDIT
jgi:UDP-glucose 4-epimerase